MSNRTLLKLMAIDDFEFWEKLLSNECTSSFLKKLDVIKNCHDLSAVRYAISVCNLKLTEVERILDTLRSSTNVHEEITRRARDIQTGNQIMHLEKLAYQILDSHDTPRSNLDDKISS